MDPREEALSRAYGMASTGRTSMSGKQQAPGRGKTRRTEAGSVSYGLLSELIGYHLRRAQAMVFDDFMRSMAEARITPGQFGVLTIIDANPGISQSALARALGIERSTMVAVLDGLEDRHLAERRASRHDRRSYALVLTPEGSALLARLQPLVRQHEARIAEDLDDGEKRTLIELLRRLRTAK
jgi:DNA-binding MarR family transcriptional regulator